MAGTEAHAEPYLICRSAGHGCALPLAAIREIMRPLPLERVAAQSGEGPLAGIVQGAAIVRGAVLPVLSLAGILGGKSNEPVSRFISLRLGERAAVLAVEVVIGIHTLEVLQDIAPLLGAVEHEAVAAITMHDAELLFVLRATKLISESALAALATSSNTEAA